ncbi:MAG: cytochrome c [Ardenticatenaceae bacterium]|nr:MAG: cytochrome c [Ardenticatenaceae bacterium]
MNRSRKQKQLADAQKQKRQKYIMSGLVVLGILLILTAVLLLRDNPGSTTADLSNRQLVAMGETVYETYCAACHGFNLEGQPEWQQPFDDGSFKAPPHDETGHTWHHSDAYLIESIKLGGARLEPQIGVSLMPAYDETLTDQQILAVLAYIKSSWPPDILAAQSSR